MKCKSCSTIIDAKLKFALNQNVCPYCGEAIMEDDLKNVISGLTQILSNYNQFKDQIESWLLANYSLISINSESFKDHIPNDIKQSFIDEASIKFKNDVRSNLIVIKDGDNQEKTEVQLKTKEDTSDFFKRAGIKDITEMSQKNTAMSEKNQRLKSVLEKIQNDETEEENESISNEGVPEALERDFEKFESNDSTNLIPTSSKEARDLASLERLVSKSRNAPNFRR